MNALLSVSRRAALRALSLAPLALPALIGRAQAAPRKLRISHQFPASSGDTGDFRDRMCRRFAELVTRATGGELEFEVYPNASLMKTFAQISGLRKGALDLGLVPLTYAGGEIHEMNISFMPALVTSYAQGYAWRTNPIGRELTSLLEERGIVLLSWMWQSGGMASRTRPLVEPADARGMKIRGGSREMDEMFKAAGASVSSMPSNEVYIGMQTGVMDAACTSSSSFLSFKLQEACKHLTTPGAHSFFFILEPIMISKLVWDTLPPAQQQAMKDVGEAMIPFNLAGAQADDVEMARVFGAAGVELHPMSDQTVEAWKSIARTSSWKQFAEKTPLAAKMLQLAEAAPG
ncbi:MAG: TRAP transporter substrate-binding protein DctP [Acetobacteraceae bacterium]